MNFRLTAASVLSKGGLSSPCTFSLNWVVQGPVRVVLRTSCTLVLMPSPVGSAEIRLTVSARFRAQEMALERTVQNWLRERDEDKMLSTFPNLVAQFGLESLKSFAAQSASFLGGHGKTPP